LTRGPKDDRKEVRKKKRYDPGHGGGRKVETNSTGTYAGRDAEDVGKGQGNESREENYQ